MVVGTKGLIMEHLELGSLPQHLEAAIADALPRAQRWASRQGIEQLDEESFAHSVEIICLTQRSVLDESRQSRALVTAVRPIDGYPAFVYERGTFCYALDVEGSEIAGNCWLSTAGYPSMSSAERLRMITEA